jgi:hypothetical protein
MSLPYVLTVFTDRTFNYSLFGGGEGGFSLATISNYDKNAMN